MPMQKVANGSNFQLGDGDITVRFQADLPVVYVVCLWGAKPQFGGQRQLVWRTEELHSARDGDKVTLPPDVAMSGMQVTWSGGIVSQGEAQGALRVTFSQKGGETSTYSYEYQFSGKDQAESFYDGLNFH